MYHLNSNYEHIKYFEVVYNTKRICVQAVNRNSAITQDILTLSSFGDYRLITHGYYFFFLKRDLNHQTV